MQTAKAARADLIGNSARGWIDIGQHERIATVDRDLRWHLRARVERGDCRVVGDATTNAHGRIGGVSGATQPALLLVVMRIEIEWRLRTRGGRAIPLCSCERRHEWPDVRDDRELASVVNRFQLGVIRVQRELAAIGVGRPPAGRRDAIASGCGQRGRSQQRPRVGQVPVVLGGRVAGRIRGSEVRPIMGVAIKLNGRGGRRGSCGVAVLIRDQDVGVVLTTIEKHADNRLIVGADLSGRNATCRVCDMVERFERGQTANHGRTGGGFQEVTALLKIFEIHGDAA